MKFFYHFSQASSAAMLTPYPPQPSADAKVIHEFKKRDRVTYASSKDPHEAYAWVEVSIPRTNEHGYVLAKYIADGTRDSRF
jgi:hypothetical protein